MRKLIITLALVIGLASMANAQSQRSIGLRLGLPMEISYQHPLGVNRLEFGFGSNFDDGVHLSGAYEWLFELPPAGLKWYFGFGPQVGLLWREGDDDVNSGVSSGVSAGGFLLFGVEYDLEQHINFPLLVSADYRPGAGIKFTSDGIKPYFPFYEYYLPFEGLALGVRFKF